MATIGSRRTRLVGACIAVALAAVSGCGGGSSSTPEPPCDQACQDASALRSLRDALKLAYNLELQGQPVGPQNATGPCPLGGTAHIAGTATANASVGSTQVSLTYVFTACAFSQTDTDPTQNYQMKLDGTVTESGTIAQQPSAATSLAFASSSISFSGSVYAPSLPYAESDCALQMGQNGNQLSGTMCGRDVGVTLH